MTEKSGLASVYLGSYFRCLWTDTLVSYSPESSCVSQGLCVRNPLITTAASHKLSVPQTGTGCWLEVAGREGKIHEAAWQPESYRAQPVLWFWKEAGTLIQVSSLRAGPAIVAGSSGPGDTTIQTWSGWAPF